MAQASVELPETTESAASASADDLLSQLAGEEIDRLLAEADSKPAGRVAVESAKQAPASADLPVGETAVAAANPETTPPALAEAPADFTAAPPSEPVTVAPAAEAGKPEDVDPSMEGSMDAIAQDDKSVMSAELDQLFNELSEPDPPAGAKGDAEAQSASATAEASTSSAERAALSEPAGKTDASDPDDGEPATLPLYLKPLVWLNAPLQLIPEPARELTGKVAIVTFMNSLALLVYLLIFRRG